MLPPTRRGFDNLHTVFDVSPNSLPWCQQETARLVYKGRIRDGRFGQLTPEAYEVLELERLRFGYLRPFPKIDYSDDSYRVAVNDSAAIEQYFKLHTAQQPQYLALFQCYLKRGLTVADCGCGGGALLDLVKEETSGRTVAIEPFTGYHDSLKDRGHDVYPDVRQAVANGTESGVDLALSFHVIEHVVDPVAYLTDIRRLVKPGGLAIVLTPNLADFLMSADPERMMPFFYRRVHNYYFSAESLAWVGRLAGWEPLRDIFYHEFGLSNALLWLRDGRPSGHARLPCIDERVDVFWKRHLEATRQSNNVGIVLRKPCE